MLLAHWLNSNLCTRRSSLDSWSGHMPGIFRILIREKKSEMPLTRVPFSDDESVSLDMWLELQSNLFWGPSSDLTVASQPHPYLALQSLCNLDPPFQPLLSSSLSTPQLFPQPRLPTTPHLPSPAFPQNLSLLPPLLGSPPALLCTPPALFPVWWHTVGHRGF